MKVTDLGELEGILCTTEEECHAILQLMHDAGLKRSNGISYLKVHNIKHLDDGGQVYIPYEGKFASRSHTVISFRVYPASDFIDTPTSSRDRIMESMFELSKPLEGGLCCNTLTGDQDNTPREKTHASFYERIDKYFDTLEGDTDDTPLVETSAEKYTRISKIGDQHIEDGYTDDTNRIVTSDSPTTNPYLNIFS